MPSSTGPAAGRFWSSLPPGILPMEACGSAHYWGRELRKLGHEVRLVAAQFVRPFVKTNQDRCSGHLGNHANALKPLDTLCVKIY